MAPGASQAGGKSGPDRLLPCSDSPSSVCEQGGKESAGALQNVIAGAFRQGNALGKYLVSKGPRVHQARCAPSPPGKPPMRQAVCP